MRMENWIVRKNTTWVYWLSSTLIGLFLFPLISFAQDIFDHNLKQLQIEVLQEEGFTAKTVQLAVFDAGFRGAASQPWFQKAVRENRIRGTFDLVGDSGVYAYSDHGTRVLSIILGDSAHFLGSAPDVTVYLFVTEDVTGEYLEEEFHWGKAVSIADSLGIQLINSSLSYTEFDDFRENHIHSELDGKTAPITNFARFAASQGILVVTSAGNYADDPWGKIGFPADADSVLTVGAVDAFDSIAGFSSYGYSADGRIKPEVVALGDSVYHYNATGSLVEANGTSFSAPIIAGLAARLMQAFPRATAQEVRTAIILSTHRFHSPDSLYGYGIPNAEKASSFLRNTVAATHNSDFTIYPNPINKGNEISVRSEVCQRNPCTLRIQDVFGKELGSVSLDLGLVDGKHRATLPQHMKSGLYIIQLEASGGETFNPLKLVVN